ncbi:hypothetical protein TNCV_2281091 [Trichonephila clavipes]|nr:hypothetical protein TNCV_2281091 [Trichonephila clavipes]
MPESRRIGERTIPYSWRALEKFNLSVVRLRKEDWKMKQQRDLLESLVWCITGSLELGPTQRIVGDAAIAAISVFNTGVHSLTARNPASRRRWATEYRDWSQLLLTDESKFSFEWDTRRVLVG